MCAPVCVWVYSRRAKEEEGEGEGEGEEEGEGEGEERDADRPERREGVERLSEAPLPAAVCRAAAAASAPAHRLRGGVGIMIVQIRGGPGRGGVGRRREGRRAEEGGEQGPSICHCRPETSFATV